METVTEMAKVWSFGGNYKMQYVAFISERMQFISSSSPSCSITESKHVVEQSPSHGLVNIIKHVLI